MDIGMLHELKTIQWLLHKYQYHGQLNVVNGLIENIETGNREGLSEIINSISMWGGSGAVWEVELRLPEIPQEESEADMIIFQKTIVDLVKNMKAEGICGDLAENRASIFLKWAPDE